jgi:DNA-binding transcriptional ArsR family regulator
LPSRAPDRIFAALADPTRCRVVERLGTAPATAGEIAAQLPVSRQAVVKHLAVLEAAGLAEGTRDGRRVVYRLTPGRFAAAAKWMGDVGAAWDRRLAALSAELAARR